MYRTLFAYVIYTLVLFTLVPAQRRAKISEADIVQAKSLREAHPEEKVVALTSREQYEFGFDAQTKTVTVVENSLEHLIATTDRSSFTAVKFYDQMSEIKLARVSNQNDRPVAAEKEDTYYQSDDYFYTDARVVYYDLDFPSTGAQRKVVFEKQYNDVKYCTSTYFSRPYPVEHREFQFIIPDWLDVELKELNFEGHDIKYEKTYDEKRKAQVHTYILKNIPAMIRERRSPGPSHIHPHILILAKSYTRNGKTSPLFGSVKDLYAWYKSLVDQMEDEPTQLNEKVTELIQGAQTDQEKISAIYYWVQDNIRYIAFEDGIAGFKPEVCQEVYDKRYGDCKGMANLTKRMLEIAGYDARLAWIGTKRIAYDYSIPSLATDNHMICAVTLDGKRYFLDPTEKFNSFTDYAERIQGKEVLIEDGSSYILDKVPVMEAEDNLEIIRADLKIQEGQLVGSAQHLYNGESKAYLLYLINQLQTDKIEEAIYRYITHGEKSIDASEVITSDLGNREQPLTITYDIAHKNAVSEFGDDIYVTLEFGHEWKDYSMEDDRQLDYLMPHKLKMWTETSLAVPEGYVVQQLPQKLEETHPDFSMEINYRLEGQQLIYTKILTSNHAVIRAKDFPRWNESIKRLSSAYQEQIVLTKQ